MTDLIIKKRKPSRDITDEGELIRDYNMYTNVILIFFMSSFNLDSLASGVLAAFFYVLLVPFSACCSCMKTITNFLHKGVELP